MEFISKSVEETAKIANDFAENLKVSEKNATVVGLYGELGSGKTTFMKSLAKAFGIIETIKSPTFVIMRKYTSPQPLPLTRGGGKENESFLGGEVWNLIHIDAYRIEKEEEMLNLGWQEIIADPKNLVCVEWPERIAGIMPSHIVITFEHYGNESQRKISIT